MNYLDNDIKFVPGVGEARARLLDKELGIRTLGDMLNHFPFRYIDRTRIYRIGEITEGGPSLVQFRARVTGIGYAGQGRKRRFTVSVSDPTGSAELVWFAGIKWVEKRIEVGREYLVFGRPSFYHNELSMVHPELETMEQALSRKPESGMQGIYSTTERLQGAVGTKGLYRIMRSTWERAADHIEETLPEELRTRYGLIPLREAYYNIHFPQSPELLRQAQYRLKFEELLGVQLNVLARRSERLARNNGFLFTRVGEAFNRFYREKLPFPLTGAQKRVIREIRQDTATGFQMNRLLQGDVGSGKTLVALMSMLLAVDNGYQACMMAPTEILARQHAATIGRMVEGLGVGGAPRPRPCTGSKIPADHKAAACRYLLGLCFALVGQIPPLIKHRRDLIILGLTGIQRQCVGGAIRPPGRDVISRFPGLISFHQLLRLHILTPAVNGVTIPVDGQRVAITVFHVLPSSAKNLLDLGQGYFLGRVQHTGQPLPLHFIQHRMGHHDEPIRPVEFLPYVLGATQHHPLCCHFDGVTCPASALLYAIQPFRRRKLQLRRFSAFRVNGAHGKMMPCYGIVGFHCPQATVLLHAVMLPRHHAGGGAIGQLLHGETVKRPFPYSCIFFIGKKYFACRPTQLAVQQHDARKTAQVHFTQIQPNHLPSGKAVNPVIIAVPVVVAADHQPVVIQP